MTKFYKTIIIGAGPAGLTAGKYLKNALILDQKKEIGKPVQCGEGISINALKLQEIETDDSWICCKIHKIERIMPNGKVIGKFHKDALGYVIDREKFEKHLSHNLKAEIRLNMKVIDLKFENNLWKVISENGKIFKSKYIIGADGPFSIVRKRVFSENQNEIELVPAIEYLLEVEKNLDVKTMKFYFDNKRYNHGYAWIFPKSRNTANIGVCGKGNLLESFNEFLKKTIKRNYGNYNLLKNKSGAVPVGKKNKKELFLKNGAMLTGDSAGFVDPVFKGGMNQAMLSAKIAAQCVLNDEVCLYETKIRSMPFTNSKLIEASKIFYSLDNQTFNELGDVFEKKEVSILKAFPGIIKSISKPGLRKNFFKMFKFFLIWIKNYNYLW